MRWKWPRITITWYCSPATAISPPWWRRGKRVTVVSTLTTPTPMIADDLRRQADFFLDVADLAKTVGRASSERGHIERTAQGDRSGVDRTIATPEVKPV